MSGPLVEQRDVEAALLRPLTAAESPYIDDLCDQASTLLRTRMPTIDARIALPDDDSRRVDPAVVTATLAGVIKRYMSNPTGATSVSRGRGPFQESQGFTTRPSGSSADGELAVTDSDLAKIDPPEPATAGTIYARARRV